MSKVQPLSATGHFNFGDLENYSQGGGLQDGYYAFWWDFFIRRTTNDGKPVKGGPALVVRAVAVNLQDPNGTPVETYWNMGGVAMKNFMPDPDSMVDGVCKKLKPVPGGPGMTGNTWANWYQMLDSLYQCGMPKGFLTDDLSVLDGVWLHVIRAEAPEQRKSFGKNKATSEYQGTDDDKRDDKVVIATQAIDGGKVWEGQPGGMPAGPLRFAAPPPPPVQVPVGAPAVPARPATPAMPPAPIPAAAPVPAAPAAPARPGPARPGRPAAPVAAAPAAPAPAQAPSNGHATAADMPDIAQAAVTDVLVKNPNGGPHLKFRLDVFGVLKQKTSEEMTSAIMDTYFSNLEYLNGLLAPLGFKDDGQTVSRG